MLALPLALLCLAAGDKSAEALFDRGLDEVQALMDRRDWRSAEKRLEALLAEHRGEAYVEHRMERLVEDQRRLAFWRDRREPRWRDMVSGSLTHYSPRSGSLKLSYGPEDLDDFDVVDRDTGRRVHPLTFAGAYTLEIQGREYPIPSVGSPSPTAWVCVDKESAYAVVFGLAPREEGGNTVGAPASIVCFRDGEMTEVATQDPSPVRGGEHYKLSVQVTRSEIRVSSGGRTFLRAKKPRDSFGGCGFEAFGEFEQLRLSGAAQSSWLSGLADELLASEWERFKETFDERRELPGWLFDEDEAGEEGGAPAASDSNVGIDESLRKGMQERLRRARALAVLRRRDEANQAMWRLIADYPKAPELYEELAAMYLYAGRPEEAGKVVYSARGQGLRTEQLDKLANTLVRAQRGPQWPVVHRFESDHYLVQSDIDVATCQEAAVQLERTLRHLSTRLRPVELGDYKFRVFLFSGQASYLAYTDAVTGRPAESTGGLYSPALKQLLIWNLPDRAEMMTTVRHEGFHQYLDVVMEAPPTWFNEGLAEYYEVAAAVGLQHRISAGHPDHLATLRTEADAWLPLREFLHQGPEEFYARGLKSYAQGWLIVHYLRHSTRGNEELFQRLFSGFAQGIPNQTVLFEVLGQDLDDLEARIKRHLETL